MTIERLKGLAGNKGKFIPVVLLGIAVFSCGIAAAKVTGYFIASNKAENIVKQAIAQSKSDPKVVEAQIAKVTPIADELKKNNLFCPPPPKQNPVKDVQIFGNEVWINGKWYKAGDSVADAKILAIGPTSVTIEWNGSKKEFYPIQAEVAEASKSSRGGPPSSGQGGEGKGGSEMVTVQAQGGPRPGPGGDTERGNFMMMKGRFGEMSQEERARFFQQMRERLRSMGGGFGGGRPGGDRGGRGSRGGRR